PDARAPKRAQPSIGINIGQVNVTQINVTVIVRERRHALVKSVIWLLVFLLQFVPVSDLTPDRPGAPPQEQRHATATTMNHATATQVNAATPSTSNER